MLQSCIAHINIPSITSSCVCLCYFKSVQTKQQHRQYFSVLIKWSAFLKANFISASSCISQVIEIISSQNLHLQQNHEFPKRFD